MFVVPMMTTSRFQLATYRTNTVNGPIIKLYYNSIVFIISGVYIYRRNARCVDMSFVGMR